MQDLVLGVVVFTGIILILVMLFPALVLWLPDLAVQSVFG